MYILDSKPQKVSHSNRHTIIYLFRNFAGFNLMKLPTESFLCTLSIFTPVIYICLLICWRQLIFSPHLHFCTNVVMSYDGFVHFSNIR